jgi:hypothetical protein
MNKDMVESSGGPSYSQKEKAMRNKTNRFADVNPSALNEMLRQRTPSIWSQIAESCSAVWQIITRSARDPMIPNHRSKK